MINFFKCNRWVSGSISIMLALLLLPLYTCIAVIIESARYRSAQEQLGELTFLGEMAILADYIDFLATDYNLYAFDQAEIKDSFSKYMNSVASAGGVDTRKLNKLFGVDMEKCDIKYMYSIADPTVLAYQIRQNGRYALPIDVMNEVVLSTLFQDINKQLKNVNKKLAVVKHSADAVNDATDMIYQFKEMREALSDLNGKKLLLTTVQNSCLQKSQDVDWTVLDSDEFEEVYKMMIANEDITVVQDRKDSSWALYNIMVNLQDDMENYFKCSEADKADFKIKIDSEIKDNVLKYLNISPDSENKANCGTVLNNLTLGLMLGSPIRDIDGYNKAMENLFSSYQDDVKLYEIYDRSGPLFEFVDNYKNEDYGYYACVKKLYEEYDRYITAVKKMAASFSGMVDSYDAASATLETMKFDSDIKDLNEKGGEAREDRAEYENRPEDLDKFAEEELRKNMDESAQKRREAYQTARKNRDFASVGTNVLDKFVAEVTEDILNNWKENFSEYFDTKNPKCIPNFNSVSNVDQYKAAARQLIDYNFETQFIKKYDFFSANGGTTFSSDDYSDKIEEFIGEFSVISESSEEKFSDKPFIDNAALNKIYSIFIDLPAGSNLQYLDSEHPWFSFDDKTESYYFSEQTIIMFFAFLIGSTFITEESGANEILKTIQSIFDTLGNLMPDDASLNNHIGYKSNANSLSSSICTFPSEGSYYKNVSLPSGSDPNSIEETARKMSEQYLKAVIKDTEKFSLGSYYINPTAPPNWYDTIFAGRQPGNSIQLLVQGSAGVLDNTSNFLQSVSNFNLIKGLKALGGFIASVAKLVTGIITFCLDIMQIIASVINDLSTGSDNTLQYILNQLYIGYFAKNNFTSRQTAKGCDGDYFSFLEKHQCNDHCFDDKIIFDGAEMEYLLNGSPCEITNQHTAFYALLVIRFLLNFTAVAGDQFVQQLTNVPYVGPVLLFIAVLVESNLDMMFLIGGVKVPLIKYKMSLNPENLETFVKALSEAVENTQQQKMKWTMTKTENGDMYRKYENNNKTLDQTFNSTLEESAGVGKNAQGVLPLDYDWYINILLLLYPENVKLGRISDLIQMHGMEKKGTSFRLENCYTYVYADVRAEYSPLLPMISGNKDSVLLPDLRTIQVNGY